MISVYQFAPVLGYLYKNDISFTSYKIKSELIFLMKIHVFSGNLK